MILFFFLYYLFIKSRKQRNVCLVIGDVRRSPRMTYHAIAFLRHFKEVTLVGERDRKLMDPILPLPLTTEAEFEYYDIGVTNVPTFLPRFIQLPLKLFLQSFSIFLVFIRLLPINILLVQNPPSVPVLGFCALFRLLRLVANFTVDWHNYGYTLISIGSNSIILLFYSKIYKIAEFFFARFADNHICVSKAMKNDLDRLEFFDETNELKLII
ncbi:hypothetical protein MXB_1419 [Myxobolus squamalis]|nr:hypothetical protein MXB_1419 [Myxobolus squamalis]